MSTQDKIPRLKRLSLWPLALKDALAAAMGVPPAIPAPEADPLAPLFALFLAAFARNKVEGFALTKASGVLFVPPVAAYFVAPPWQWAFGVFPTFWPVKAFWEQQGVGSAAVGPAVSAPIVLVAIGIVVQAGVVWLLLRRFSKVMSA